MEKSTNAPSLLSVMLYFRITGAIQADNEWTAVARWLDLPPLHRPMPQKIKGNELVQGLAEEIAYHALHGASFNKYKDTSTALFVIADAARMVARCFTEQEQIELLTFLRTKQPIQLGE